jgi:predicted nucleotidyltransferase
MNQALIGSSVKIKKYFYMLRPLLAASWIERYHTIPPMELAFLLQMLDDQPEIKNCIIDLQERKQHIDELIPIARIAMIDDFLTTELTRLQESAKKLPAGNGDMGNLDRLFQQCLGL